MLNFHFKFIGLLKFLKNAFKIRTSILKDRIKDNFCKLTYKKCQTNTPYISTSHVISIFNLSRSENDLSLKLYIILPFIAKSHKLGSTGISACFLYARNIELQFLACTLKYMNKEDQEKLKSRH